VEPALRRRKSKSSLGDFSTSVARQVFHQLFRSAAALGDFIARQPDLWPVIQVSAGTIDFQPAKQIPFMR
jgi:hypothetical protein